jgi:hypothetical protein
MSLSFLEQKRQAVDSFVFDRLKTKLGQQSRILSGLSDRELRTTIRGKPYQLSDGLAPIQDDHFLSLPHQSKEMAEPCLQFGDLS